MLGASIAGENLPSFLIFKGKKFAQMEYGVHDWALMDEILMLEWIEKVLKPATQHNRFSYLILDDCHFHLTVMVTASFASCNTELE
jgi:DDE superfamily endonuclease